MPLSSVIFLVIIVQIVTWNAQTGAQGELIDYTLYISKENLFYQSLFVQKRNICRSNEKRLPCEGDTQDINAPMQQPPTLLRKQILSLLLSVAIVKLPTLPFCCSFGLSYSPAARAQMCFSLLASRKRLKRNGHNCLICCFCARPGFTFSGGQKQNNV